MKFIITVGILTLGICYLFTTVAKNNRLSCIDGDTFYLNGDYYRLAYIDTKEKNNDLYQAGKDYTCKYLNEKNYKLTKTGIDKYNRILVEVSVDGDYRTLNELLISECLAEPYYLNTKDYLIELFNFKCKNYETNETSDKKTIVFFN